MQVPEYILERMAKADETGEGQAEGVAIAREALAAARDRVQGAYIMPPFGRYKAAMKVLEGYVTPRATMQKAATELALTSDPHEKSATGS